MKMNESVSFDALKESAINYGDMISVHVESPWGGKPSDIGRVRRSGAKQKILAKGIHPTDEHIEQSLNYGADRVLVGEFHANLFFPIVGLNL